MMTEEISYNKRTDHLMTKWIAAYTLYDDNLDHAYNAWINMVYDWSIIARRTYAKSFLPNLFPERRLIASFNKALRNDLRNLMAHLEKDHHMDKHTIRKAMREVIRTYELTA